MNPENPLVRAMVDECRSAILEWNDPDPGLPEALQPEHLQGMCDRVEAHLGDWSASKVHRWIGFIQCAMIAHRMLDLDGAKAMFNKAKNAFGQASDDLVDHLDPGDFFELDIGGEG